MVLSSTLKSVRDAMSLNTQSIRAIAEKTELTRGTVKYSLDVLIDLGVVERVDGISASEKNGGWNRATYRLQSRRL